MDRDQLREIAGLLVDEGLSDAQRRANIEAIAGDASLAGRAIDWLPEAFGYVLLAHMADLDFALPDTFQVKSLGGEWRVLPFATEPLAKDAIALGLEMIHSGPRPVFETLALRSSSVATVNNALNAGADLSGATLSGPAFVSLPAEWYEQAHDGPRGTRGT